MKHFKCASKAMKKYLPNQEDVITHVSCNYQKDAQALVDEKILELGLNPEHFRNASLSACDESEANASEHVDDEAEENNNEHTKEVAYKYPTELTSHSMFNTKQYHYLESDDMYCNVAIYKKEGFYKWAYALKCGDAVMSGMSKSEFETHKDAALAAASYSSIKIKAVVKIAEDGGNAVSDEVKFFSNRCSAHFEGLGNITEFNDSDFHESNIELAKRLGVQIKENEELPFVGEPDLEDDVDFTDEEKIIIDEYPKLSDIKPLKNIDVEESDVREIEKDKGSFIAIIKEELEKNKASYNDLITGGYDSIDDDECLFAPKSEVLSTKLEKLLNDIEYDLALIDFAEAYAKEDEPKIEMLTNEPKDKIGSMIEKLKYNSQKERDKKESMANGDQIVNGPEKKQDVVIEKSVSFKPDTPIEQEDVSDAAEDMIISSLIGKQEKTVIKVEPLSEGVYNDLPDTAYHGDKGSDSSTDVKNALVSGMYYNKCKKELNEDKPKKRHFEVGKLIHAMVLEADTVKDRFIVEPDTPRKPTKPQLEAHAKGKATDKAIASIEFWDKFEKENSDKVVCKQEDWDLASNMRAAVYDDDDCAPILSHPLAKKEVSYFKIDPETSLMLKVRPDISVSKLCLDVKSIQFKGEPCAHEIEERLRREILQRGYHVSAAMYADIGGFNNFAWIFINKTEGHHFCNLIIADDEMMELGHLLYMKGKKIIADGRDRKKWEKPVTGAVKIGLDYKNKQLLIKLREEAA